MADAAAAAEVGHDSDDEEASRDWDGDFSPAGQVLRGSASDDLTSPAARSDWASDGEEVLDARYADRSRNVCGLLYRLVAPCVTGVSVSRRVCDVLHREMDRRLRQSLTMQEPLAINDVLLQVCPRAKPRPAPHRAPKLAAA